MHKRKSHEDNSHGNKAISYYDENKRPRNTNPNKDRGCINSEGYHDIGSSKNSTPSLVSTPVSPLFQVKCERKALDDGSIARGLVKSRTCHSSGVGLSNLFDLSLNQKPRQYSPSIPADEDAERSIKNTQIPFEEDDPLGDYGQFIEFFDGLGLRT